MLKVKRVNKSNLLYGMVWFVILLLADIYNIFTRIICSIGAYEFFTIVIVTAAIVIIYFRIDISIKMPINSDMDEAIKSAGYTLAIYLLFQMIALTMQIKIFAWYKLIGTVLCLLFLAIVYTYRIRILEKSSDKYKETREIQNNTVTLQELYQGQMDKQSDTMILLDEDVVDYDLLHRKELIESISTTIKNCYPNKKFVLSLSGNWGSGKTTILNLVKKQLQDCQENIIIIDDFDPWNFEDEAALLGAILDTIFQKMNLNYSISKQRAWKKDLIALIFNINAATRGVKFSFFKENINSVSKIRNQINEYMSFSDQRLVFILDNIERLGSERMLFLLKTVADVLNLDRVTYILSYDPRIMERLLAEQKYDMEYLKKIVQMEFCVPELDTDLKKDLMYHCVSNMLKTYRIEDEKRNEILNIVPLLTDYTQDVRDIKRFLNSIMSVLYYFSNEQNKRLAMQLNICDYIIIELIKRENGELYSIIWKNATYFVSADRETMFGFEDYLQVNQEKKNAEIIDFYKKIFSSEKNSRYLNLLKRIFPYVNHYVMERNNIINKDYTDEKYEQTIKKHRIYSGNYFPIYFTLHSNEHLEIQNIVEKMIGLCNANNREEAKQELKVALREFNAIEYKIMEEIQLYTNDLTQQGWEVLFDLLYDYTQVADDSMMFLRLNAKRRAIYILSLAVENVSEQFFDNFLLCMQKEYNRMNTIHSIIWHNRIENDTNEGNKEVCFEGRNENIYETLKMMAVYIIEHKIDLYTDPYYSVHNIWGWYHSVKDNSEINVKEAFHYMLTTKNIFRFLWDMTGESLSGVYGYRLNRNNFEVFCSFDEIENYMADCCPTTADEKFITEIYEAYKNGTNDSEREVYRGEEMKVKL